MEKNLHRLPAEDTQKTDASFSPWTSAAACREAAVTQQSEWICAPCHSTGDILTGGTRAPVPEAAHKAQARARGFLGSQPLQPTSPLRKGPRTHRKRRSYFNFLKFLMLLFSEVKVSINISVAGRGVGDPAFLHSFPTVQSIQKPLLKSDAIIWLTDDVQPHRNWTD